MKAAADIGRNDMAKSNKVAIVTGSATGLGASCALDLAERGWNVAINYTKSKKEADETYEAVKAKGVEAILVQADMGQDARLPQACGRDHEEVGPHRRSRQQCRHPPSFRTRATSTASRRRTSTASCG
jgi:hypothetical protein